MNFVNGVHRLIIAILVFMADLRALKCAHLNRTGYFYARLDARGLRPGCLRPLCE